MKFKQLLAMFASIIALLLSAYTSEAIAADDVCWKTSYGRGVGSIPDRCLPGQQRDGALCYPACNAGFAGIGPVCWGACPAGFSDVGAFCNKPPETNYARVPYTVAFGQACKDAAGGVDCVWEFAAWYAKCKPGYTGAPLKCYVAQACPVGFAETAANSCTKPSYGRSAGASMVCDAGKASDAGLCYERCRDNYDGLGPVCYGRCSGQFPLECGGLCATDSTACAKATTELVLSSLEMIGTIVATIATGGAASAVKAAAKTAATIAAKEVTREVAVSAIRRVALETGKVFTEAQILNMAKASVGLDFELESLDPTGIAGLVKAFNKPICGAPGVTPRGQAAAAFLSVDRFDYKAWDGSLWSAGRAQGSGGVSNGVSFIHSEKTTGKTHTDRVINYLTAGGAKWQASITGVYGEKLLHQPQVMVGKFDGLGRPQGAQESTFMDYISWDGNVYRTNWDVALSKWKVAKQP